jgi:hypothetical protein
MRKLPIFLGMAISVFIIAQTAQATQVINDTLQVNSLKVGQQGLGGVTYFNGTIINSTTTSGADNPVTFGDNVRIDGVVYRGATAGTGDTKPFKINDNAEIAGNLTVAGALSVGSLTGLSSMVSAAGFAQISDLASYARTTDLASYAKTTDLTSYAKKTDLTPYALATTVSSLSDTVDLNYYWQFVVYEYDRCVLYLDELETSPLMDDMLWCWALWVGTDISDWDITSTAYSTLMFSPTRGNPDYTAKIQAMVDRVTERNR